MGRKQPIYPPPNVKKSPPPPAPPLPRIIREDILISDLLGFKRRDKMQIDYDKNNDIIMIEGVKYSGIIFRTLSFPDLNKVYSFVRENDVVTVTSYDISPEDLKKLLNKEGL